MSHLNFGTASLREVEDLLASHGLTLSETLTQTMENALVRAYGRQGAAPRLAAIKREERK